MTDALKDLEAFMVKARDMVRLAQDLNDRLSATTGSASSSSPYPSGLSSEPEEATFIRSSLSQLGLQMANAPVTLDMIKDERKWEEQLVRELADVIQGDGPGNGILRGRGTIGLDEVWGGWNRARGICKPATSQRELF
jgi:ESCRT-II complex subunit VPS36